MNWQNLIDRKFMTAIAIAATISAMVGFGFWSFNQEYGVVFSNINSKDGGSIIAALEQMNVPYKTSDGGATILVPSDQVAQIRLKLASMGLPKGSNSGFDLLENQKFGVSQFVEQTNYQRALIGELEKSIQSINAIESVKVILGLPKQTVFVRDQKKPTASVMIKLLGSRSLTEQQVQAIVHLVATSVADLTPENISMVDQTGTLLWDPTKKAGHAQLDSNKFKLVNEVQNNIVKRIENILIPVAGVKNIRAQATADLDFTNSEQSEEIYKPNKEGNSTIRSQQVNESAQPNAATASGVPGAESNLRNSGTGTAPNGPQDPQGTEVTQPAANNTSRTSTISYEVDKTLKYSQKEQGAIKRLSVAVVLNNKQTLNADGKVVEQSWAENEIDKITALTKDAMGYNSARGDSLTVTNIPFAAEITSEIEAPPFWRSTAALENLKMIAKLFIDLVVFIAIYRLILSPLIKHYVTDSRNILPAPTADQNTNTAVQAYYPVSQEFEKVPKTGYQNELEQAKLLAKEDPKLVANIISSWMSRNG